MWNLLHYCVVLLVGPARGWCDVLSVFLLLFTKKWRVPTCGFVARRRLQSLRHWCCLKAAPDAVDADVAADGGWWWCRRERHSHKESTAIANGNAPLPWRWAASGLRMLPSVNPPIIVPTCPAFGINRLPSNFPIQPYDSYSLNFNFFHCIFHLLCNKISLPMYLPYKWSRN